MSANDGTLVMEDARILFRNFAGREGMYNSEGDRNFCVLLEHDVADAMAKDGWNVKFLKPREEGEEPQPYIQVSLKYRGRNGAKVRPPRTVMITSKGRTDLHEDEVELFDWVDIKNVDIIVRPYQWAVSGKSGVKAYVKSLFVTIAEDELEMKYSDIPEIERSSNAVATIEAGPGDDIIDAEAWEVDEPKELN